MKAEIIAIGTELLLGEIADTNTSFLARQLALLGIDLHHAQTVGDNRARLVATLRQAWRRADVIITTGGLGPTQGDITREVIAALLKEKPALDAALKDDLIAFFRRRGMAMPENNLRQAVLVPSARAIPNRRGTAPGWWAEKEGKIIIALPGPPGELQGMWHEEVSPRLEKKSGAVILSRTVKTWGIGEARVDEMVAELLTRPNPTLAIYAKPYGIQLRITAKAAEKELASKMLSECEEDLRRILGNSIWGTDEETLETVLGRWLIGQGLTLASAETLTGGLCAATLTEDPASRQYFRGGLVFRDVPTSSEFGGEVGGEEAARRLALLARQQFAADIGLAVTGTTEATGAMEIGRVFLALDNRGVTASRSENVSGRPPQLKRRAVQHALFHLYLTLCSSQR